MLQITINGKRYTYIGLTFRGAMEFCIDEHGKDTKAQAYSWSPLVTLGGVQ